MNRSAKGAVAAAAGVVLLLTGQGTLAFWTDTNPISGGAVNSGHLNIVTDGVNTGCGDWTLDDDESPASTYTVGDPLVPGDVLTRVCAYTVEAEGNHLRATLGISTASFSGTDGDFGGSLVADVSGIEVDSVPATAITDLDDGKTLTATVTVTFDPAADNTTEDLETVLDLLTLTATQVHA